MACSSPVAPVAPVALERLPASYTSPLRTEGLSAGKAQLPCLRVFFSGWFPSFLPSPRLRQVTVQIPWGWGGPRMAGPSILKLGKSKLGQRSHPSTRPPKEGVQHPYFFPQGLSPGSLLQPLPTPHPDLWLMFIVFPSTYGFMYFSLSALLLWLPSLMVSGFCLQVCHPTPPLYGLIHFVPQELRVSPPPCNPKKPSCHVYSGRSRRTFRDIP